MKTQRGFTIIELMIVVVIIGILAAIAIPMFTSHVAHAKASEAMLQLNKMSIDAKTYYFANTKYPQGTASVLPGADGAACAQASKRFVVSSAWAADSVWSGLGFQIDEPNMFSYHFTSNTLTQAQGLAVGDLDCDGVKITYIVNLNAQQEPAATFIQPAASAD